MSSAPYQSLVGCFQRKPKGQTVPAPQSPGAPLRPTPRAGGGSRVWPRGLVFINRHVGNASRVKKGKLAEAGVGFKMTQFIFGDWDYAPWETRKEREPD